VNEGDARGAAEGGADAPRKSNRRSRNDHADWVSTARRSPFASIEWPSRREKRRGVCPRSALPIHTPTRGRHVFSLSLFLVSQVAHGPVLVITGDGDPFGEEPFEQTVRALTSAKVTTATMVHCGHDPMLEAYGALIAKLRV
jgi:pimeloyl-ACP methyl ester carboxylesterase